MVLRVACLGWLLFGLIASGCAAASTRPARAAGPPAPSAQQGPDWQPLSAASFERAAREQRMIVLSVQAAWCHWCHVMNAQTLQDHAVVALLDAHFVVIRVDADARPDIAARYAAFGWPATALLTPEGASIVNLRGYQSPAAFGGLLRALRARQLRGEPLQARAGAQEPLPAGADLRALHAIALAQIADAYDTAQHGYGGPKKYPHAAPIELALLRAAPGGKGSAAELEAALASLERYTSLIDPVAGGMFQYSVWNRWDRPHYEKIHSVQADALRVFALASRTRGASWLAPGRDVARYVLGPLRAEDGSFFANQDADVGHAGAPGHMTGAQYYALDARARARLPAPHIDRSIYAAYNGMSIAALCALFEATEDPSLLTAARAAYARIELSHARGPLYAHAAADAALIHLGDQVEMGYALLALYDATADAAFLQRLLALLDAVERALFDATEGAYASHTRDPNARGVLAEPLVPLEENARLARLLLRTAAITHAPARREHALSVLRALGHFAPRLLVESATPDDPARRALRQGAGDYALALETALSPYAVLTVVGPYDDARTQALLAGARRYAHPNRYLRHDAPGEGDYPYPGSPALYLCTNNACSLPIAEPDAIAEAADAFMAQQE